MQAMRQQGMGEGWGAPANGALHGLRGVHEHHERITIVVYAVLLHVAMREESGLALHPCTPQPTISTPPHTATHNAAEITVRCCQSTARLPAPQRRTFSLKTHVRCQWPTQALATTQELPSHLPCMAITEHALARQIRAH